MCSRGGGGLGIYDICLINEAYMMKLFWDFNTATTQWENLCHARFINFNINKYIKSSIWHKIKSKLGMFKLHSSQVIGDGKSINFWCNTWLPHMVGEALNLPGRISSSLKYTVSDFLHNGSWNLTPFLQICALNLVAGIVQMDILISHRPNELIWEKYDSRSLTLKIAFNFLCGNDILLKRGCTIVSQCNLCCSTLKPPSTSFFSAICSFSLELAFK